MNIVLKCLRSVLLYFAITNSDADHDLKDNWCWSERFCVFVLRTYISIAKVISIVS